MTRGEFLRGMLLILAVLIVAGLVLVACATPPLPPTCGQDPSCRVA